VLIESIDMKSLAYMIFDFDRVSVLDFWHGFLKIIHSLNFRLSLKVGG